MTRFVALMRARIGAGIAVAIALQATGMLRVLPSAEVPDAWVFLALSYEQFAGWLLLCLMIVAITCGCEALGSPGRGRLVVQSAILAVATPLYAAFVASSPLLTIQVRKYGLGDAEGIAWYSAWFGWVVSALLSWYYRALALAASAGSSLRNAELARQQAQRDVLESRLQVLEARVEPGFLLDTLARVQAMYASDASRAVGMLEDLIEYLHAALAQSRERSTTLGRELALVRAYLRIVAGDAMEVVLLDAGIERAYAPPMILLPMAQSALRARPACGAPPLRLEAGVERSGRTFVRMDFDVRNDWDEAKESAPIRGTLRTLFGTAAELAARREGARATIELSWPDAPRNHSTDAFFDIREEAWTVPLKSGAS